MRWLRLGFVLFFVPSGLSGVSEQAEKANARALVLLGEENATGAEEAARQALMASARFDPQEEIPTTPEKGLLFEDMIAEARTEYRSRRGRYFLTLGRALTRQERWIEGRKALRRAATLLSSADPYLVIASHTDLSISEQIEALLAALFTTGVNRAVVLKALMETGAFPNADTLRALTDERRFREEVLPEFPEIEVSVEPFPDIRIATDRGVFVSSEYLDSGAVLVIYLPASGCGRCSEELDGVNRAVIEGLREGKPIVWAALVSELDLAAARRIARLMALRLQVGRSDRLPLEARPDSDGEIRIVARRGLLQIRIPLIERPPSHEIRKRTVAVLKRIEPIVEEDAQASGPALRALRQLEARGRSRQVLIEASDQALQREAGPISPQEHYQILERATRSVLSSAQDPAGVYEVLERLSVLRGAGRAKSQAMHVLDDTWGQKLLETAKRLEPGVDRQAAPSAGVFTLAVSEPSESPLRRQIILQRSFFDEDSQSLLHFGFVVGHADGGLEVQWGGGRGRGAQGCGKNTGRSSLLLRETRRLSRLALGGKTRRAL